MKTIKTFLLLFSIISIPLSAQTTKRVVKSSGTVNKIEAYYFHYTSRCVTCKTVEAEAKKNLETLYPQLVKKGLLSFRSLNLEESAGEALAKKLEVSGQTLLLVKGNNKINITNEGFLYARSNPEKFKSVIKEKVDELLKNK
ncbi:nitrophenyl compound nitroreductase subunit ArsF family protein [Parabacteroides sp. FAFU027]|uniref:nitrophenyl compound nitroreductase subunit ArsF family protein n=1 Tax=Parabacteroides sp. FAFU027 TaxID=2922715 RepID=UPI001FAFA752|nr:nitrophenyl compound nitroreductase subunit ArsF family protein [Parabacteroides sp. FAFU027]